MKIALAILVLCPLSFALGQSKAEKALSMRLEISEAGRLKALADLDAVTREKDSLIREFKSLHAADADLMKRITTNARNHADLESRVGALDISVDTRLLMQATDDIKALKAEQQRREERATEERKSNADMIRTIQTGTIMLVIGAAISGVGAAFKFLVIDPRRRLLAAQAQDANKGEVLQAVEHGIQASTAGIRHSNNLSEKLVEQANQIVAMREDLVTAVKATNDATERNNADRESRV